MKKRYITWHDFDSAVRQLSARVHGKFKAVAGVPRGGLPLAVSVSHRLNIELVELSKGVTIPECLIIDDISDRGDTLLKLNVPRERVAVWHVTPHTKFVPAFFCDITAKGERLIYPWDRS